MAKKTRKKTALKKTAASARARTKKSKTKKSKAAKPKAWRKVKAKSPSLGQRLSNAYRTVVDTMTGTGALRSKLEKPGTSESE